MSGSPVFPRFSHCAEVVSHILLILDSCLIVFGGYDID